MVNLSDVAAKAGVNLSTASRSLSGAYGVHPKTRAKVIEVSRKLGYRPNRVAQVLATGRSKSLGLIVSDIRNPFFAEIARGAEDTAYRAGLDLILCNTDLNPEKQVRYIDSLLEKQVEGIVMNSVASLTGEQMQRLSEITVPIILLNRSKLRKLSTVSIDNYKGGRMAAKYLIDLGHRRTVHLSGPRNHSNLRDRARGFVDQYEESRIKAPIVIHGQHTESGGYELAMELLRKERGFTAISTGNDVMAFGVLRAAAELEVRVPRDLSLIGFDDVSIGAIVNPPLTTIHQPSYEVGSSAVDLLLSLIAGGSVAAKGGHRRLDVSLMERSSCAPFRS
jgi:LacI family transcriptional regulator